MFKPFIQNKKHRWGVILFLFSLLLLLEFILLPNQQVIGFYGLLGVGSVVSLLFLSQVFGTILRRKLRPQDHSLHKPHHP